MCLLHILATLCSETKNMRNQFHQCCDVAALLVHGRGMHRTSLQSSLLLKLHVLVACALLYVAAQGELPTAATTVDEQCFCAITGEIEDCSCDAETLESINRKLFHTLQALVKTDFFKYYKVNLHRGCRFWQANSICSSEKCEVHTCPRVRPWMLGACFAALADDGQ